MQHYEWVISIPESDQDNLIAYLAEYGFEAFVQEPQVLKAYASFSSLDVLPEIKRWLSIEFEPEINAIQDQNWNQEWELNYPSVFLGNEVQVYPAFRTPEDGYRFSIKITPQMSFGTGHHETTRIMIQQLLHLGGWLKDKVILDMGTGTGILAILAEQLGASKVIAIDNDMNSYQNALENVKANRGAVEVILGNAFDIPNYKYDLILANINTNVLLEDSEVYCGRLGVDSRMCLSGFFDFDAPKIKEHYQYLDCHLLNEIIENNWVSLLFQR